MRFDAYAGTVWDAKFHDVAQMIAFGAHCRVEHGKPRGRYNEVLEVRDGAEAIGWVGEDRVSGAPYFEFKGVRTPDAAAALRKHWDGAHQVSRADVCDDYNEPGAYPRLVKLVDEFKGDPRVHSESITPRDGDRGETIYWGSRQARTMVRCYEKGKQKENLHLAKPHWARIELQTRPGKALEKRAAALMAPLSFWGFGRWTQNVATQLTGLEIERFAPPQEAPEFDRTTLYLARTFRRHLAEMRADFGTPDMVWREFESIWARDDQAGAGVGTPVSQA
jgi:hypothetical protein